MYEVVREINQEYMDELDEIKASNPYDELEMSGSRAVWPEVLSVYAVKVTTDPDNGMEVATVTDEKIEILKEIFWEMNEIDYSTSAQTVTMIVELDDGNGNILEEEVQDTITTLRIVVSHKTADEMAQEYGFYEDQKEQLVSLLDRKTTVCALEYYMESMQPMIRLWQWHILSLEMWAVDHTGPGMASAPV